MNDSVRNPVFFPAFFGPPFVAAVAAVAAWRCGARPAAVLFLLAGALYAVGGIALTAAVNVPMNDALDAGGVPSTVVAAQEVWQAYSERWQRWNLVRTVVSGVSLAAAALATSLLRTSARAPGSSRPELPRRTREPRRAGSSARPRTS
jgi:uncharacterized membrane protein